MSQDKNSYTKQEVDQRIADVKRAAFISIHDLEDRIKVLEDKAGVRPVKPEK